MNLQKKPLQTERVPSSPLWLDNEAHFGKCTAQDIPDIYCLS